MIFQTAQINLRSISPEEARCHLSLSAALLHEGRGRDRASKREQRSPAGEGPGNGAQQMGKTPELTQGHGMVTLLREGLYEHHRARS